MARRTASAIGSCFSRFSEAVAERFALDEGHHVVKERPLEALDFPRVVERQDMGMLEVGGGPDLGEEPLGPDHRGELGPEHLERHLAVMPEVYREIDDRHPAVTDLALDAIAVAQGLGNGGLGGHH